MSKELIKHLVEVLSRCGYINFSALRLARFSDSSTAIDFAMP
jgi:hypothetical protein